MCLEKSESCTKLLSHELWRTNCDVWNTLDALQHRSLTLQLLQFLSLSSVSSSGRVLFMHVYQKLWVVFQLSGCWWEYNVIESLKTAIWCIIILYILSIWNCLHFLHAATKKSPSRKLANTCMECRQLPAFTNHGLYVRTLNALVSDSCTSLSHILALASCFLVFVKKPRRPLAQVQEMWVKLQSNKFRKAMDTASRVTGKSKDA